VTCPQLVDSGVYVLGALPPAQRLAFEAHMAQCDECRSEVNELAVLPGLLARVDATSFETEAASADDDPAAERRRPHPVDLLPGVIRRVNRRRRTRRIGAMVGVLAVACLALFAGLVLPHQTTKVPAPAVAAPITWHQMQSMTASPITAKVALTSTGSGTTVALKCNYPSVVSDPNYEHGAKWFALFVYPRNGGSPQQIGTWSASPGDQLTIPAVTAWGLADVSEVQMRSSDGTPLLSYNVT
jgi:anti-sigma factor RsiW